MSSKTKRSLLWVLVVGLALCLAVVGVMILRRPTFVPPTLPEPNGYEKLLAAAEMLHPRTGFFDEMESDELAEVAEHNKLALDIAGDALDTECGVPVDWTRDPLAQGFDEALLDQAQAMRALSRALRADARACSLSGDAERAVQSGLATYRLGTKCNNGGLLVGHLVGIAIRTTAIDELGITVNKHPEQRLAIIEGLVPLIDTSESVEDVIQRETEYVDSASRGIVYLLNKRSLQALADPAHQSAKQAELRGKGVDRLFLVHLALHLYQSKHGSWPASLDELAPDVLTSVPLDPYSQAPFIYRTIADGYELYSVGSNGRDDGGEGDDSGVQPDLVFDLPESASDK